jgi:hypothetical protein
MITARPSMGCRDMFSVLRDDVAAAIQELWRPGFVDGLRPKDIRPAREIPLPRSGAGQMAEPTSGSRANRARDVAPGPQPREGRGRVEHDAVSRIAAPAKLAYCWSKRAITDFFFGSNPKVIWVMQSVAIEPLRLSVSKRLSAASIAPTRGPVAVFFRRSRIFHARTGQCDVRFT